MKTCHIQKIVAIMLLTFCGQVLAAPLFNCCLESNQGQNSSESGMVMDHSMMDMDMHSLHMDMQSSDLAANQDAISSMTDDMNCDHLCEVCISSAPSVPTEIDIVSKAVSLPLKGSAYVFFITSSSSDNPFRPPKVA